MMNHHLLLLLTTSLLVSCILTVAGTCPAGQSPCLTDRDVCVNSSQICDGTLDCQDQTDEIFCPCMGEELKCDNSMAPSEDNCFALAGACDGAFDCPPGVNTDEDPDTICGPSGVCPGSQILCPNQTTSCVSNALFCDDNSDCPNMGDESPQFCGCPNTESGEIQVAFQCATSLWVCLNRTQICDGVSDCDTGYDEYPQNSMCSPDMVTTTDIINSTMATTNSSTDLPIAGIAVGAVVGVVLVAVAIVIVVLVCCKKKKKSKVQVISTEQTSPSKKAPMELAPVTK